MPLVRIALRRGKSPAYRASLRDGVHRALCSTFEVPEDDRFARNLAGTPGLRPEDVLIALTENSREDWSLGKGVAQYVA